MTGFSSPCQQAVPPVGEARSDYDIFAGLATRLGVAEAYTEGRGEMDWLRHMYDVARRNAARFEIEMPGFDAFWEKGFFEFEAQEDSQILFEAFRNDPEKAALKTPSGKIEIFSETIDCFGYDDCPGHPAWLEPVEWLGSDKAARHPLHLISNQPLRRMHSQLDFGGPSQDTKVAGREPVWLHPDDATSRGVGDGDVVRLFNDRRRVPRRGGGDRPDTVRRGAPVDRCLARPAGRGRYRQPGKAR